MTLRKILSLVIVILLLNGDIRSNPIIPTFMNELQVDSVGWTLELSPEPGEFNLDGWYLTTTSDTAYFKDNIYLPADTFLIITQDSLLNPLLINPLGDSLVLHDSNDYDVEWLVFGESSNSIISNPQPHQSLSRCVVNYQDFVKDYYYLDNTPTLGFDNDSEDATGNVEGFVTDTLGVPLDSVRVFHYYEVFVNTYIESVFVYTDGNGYFEFNHIANRKYFCLDKVGYETQIFIEQIYPDSSISLSIEMEEHSQSIDTQTGNILNSFYLYSNYPNPFNSTTTFYYHLPLNTQVEFRIYNLKGELVDNLFYGYQNKGQYKINWNPQDLPSGVYIYQLNTPEMFLNKKCILLK